MIASTCGKHGIEIAFDPHALAGERIRQQRARTDERDVDAQHPHPDDVRARDARVLDVADDRDAQSLEVPGVFAQGHQIEQRLGRVRVRAVARVDDVAVERFREPARKTRFGVAHDDHADADRAQRDRGVGDRLALPQRRCAGRERDHVCADPLFGERERRRRARARFEKQVEDGNAGEEIATRAADSLNAVARSISRNQFGR